MQNLGKVFKQLRKAKHVSLSEATGGSFSTSMLSRFESGNHEISASKLLSALENIHCTPSEFLFMANNYENDALGELGKEISAARENLPLSMALYNLTNLYKKECKRLAALRVSGHGSVSSEQVKQTEQECMIRIIILKSCMQGINDELTPTEEESEFFKKYLFGISSWGSYEISIFTWCVPLLSIRELVSYAKEAMRKIDYLSGYLPIRNNVNALLLSCFTRCIDEGDFSNAAYFKKHLDSADISEHDTYLRTVYLWAQGNLDYKTGAHDEGSRLMRQATQVFDFLGCTLLAGYYRRATANTLASQD